MGKHRRSDQFAVRRWLQLGAASAGMGAALWGFSLVGPQVGAATAETSAGSSVSDGGGDSPSESAKRTRPAPSADDADDAGDGAGDADDADGADADNADAADDDADVAEAAEGKSSRDADEDDRDEAADASSDEPDDADDVVEAPEENGSPIQSAPSVQAAPTPGPAVASTRPTHDERVAKLIADMTTEGLAWIDAQPVSDVQKERLERTLYAVRTAFFNQAPTLAPVQVAGVIDGPIAGTLQAADPDGDRLIYRLVQRPKNGTVVINGDGTYTYTPRAGFDGVDTFTVAARDLGLHVNLVDWFRPVSTRSGSLVNHKAVTFDFRYTVGAEHWTPERRAALQRAADALVEYLRVGKAVTLTYDIEGADDAQASWLGGAGSGPVSEDPGFWRTVVQHKLITGADLNHDEADGEIEWNFGFDWALGDDVGPTQRDFRNTAMHELLHSFGWTTQRDKPGTNDGLVWTTYDSFVVGADGENLIGSDFVWGPDSDAILNGERGGMFFNGAHAVAVYGRPVPLWSPHPYAGGSSMSHLDDASFPGDAFKLMNHKSKGPGPGSPRTLSELEMAMLRDLGFTVVPIAFG